MTFAGDKKEGTFLLLHIENRFKRFVVPKIPRFIETYHLTMMTVLWSAGNILAALYLDSLSAILWVVNLMIVLQYLTDLFDGELGRQRNTGLIKWGFYMDHFLDYLFLCSLVFVGYRISPPGLVIWYFALMAILGGFMVNSFLSFAATNKFRISHYGIGPTETRVGFILINVYIINAGTIHFPILVPAAVILCALGLIINTFQIQRQLWRIDMEEKQRKEFMEKAQG